jgi:hypothetical protein
MIAEPDTTLHVVEERTSLGDGVAVPLSVKVVEAPAEHFA